MYSYKSISDLSLTISKNINKIPTAIDLVVGIPRSGMLPASIISLYLNIPLTDVYSYIDGRVLQSGQTRKIKNNTLNLSSDAKHILVVDDSISSGGSINKVKNLLNQCKRNVKITFLCIYGIRETKDNVDIIFEYVQLPRLFEWNIFHHPLVNSMCFDIDGVLCKDPTPEENDDGEKYRHFIMNAEPLFVPTQKIKSLVTSRLEKYRHETEVWLIKNGIKYDNLYMLDLPDAETRRRLGVHAKHKSSIYKMETQSNLFIESELYQAHQICNITGKQVFCTEIMDFVKPGQEFKSQLNFQKNNMRVLLLKVINFLKRRFKY